jgi:glutamate formiminotransferase / formiminotetrahydrofolate cyclodeaminase
MRQIVECVPNFSEGRDPGIVKRIAEAITGVPGVKFLSAEPDKDYNRTVVTFIGEPENVLEAAFRATARAAELIDMTRHSGEHPRLGATDVVPFVPVAGVTMEDCVSLARRYGERVAGELGIPVYLYEEAASRPERKNLASIRKGEYEGLQAKLADPAWIPDFGRTDFNARSGATVTGARSFLIAYNVNLGTADVAVASEIAARVRESGRVKKDDTGAAVLDANGSKVVIPGTLRAVKAMGVLLEAHSIAQVSMNLVNFAVTPPHAAFEEVAAQARSLGVQATGSEIVGLTPRDALLLAGRHYAAGASMSDEQLLDLAIERLGLSQLEPFDRRKKIIEYQL